MSPRCTGRSFTSLTGQEPGQRSQCPHLGLPKDNKPAVEEPREGECRDRKRRPAPASCPRGSPEGAKPQGANVHKDILLPADVRGRGKRSRGQPGGHLHEAYAALTQGGDTWDTEYKRGGALKLISKSGQFQVCFKICHRLEVGDLGLIY